MTNLYDANEFVQWREWFKKSLICPYCVTYIEAYKMDKHLLKKHHKEVKKKDMDITEFVHNYLICTLGSEKRMRV